MPDKFKPKMYWNYRVVKTITEKHGHIYSIYEVHYSNGVPNSPTVNSVSPVGDDSKSFMRSFNCYITALEKPVLIFNNDTNKFEGEEPAFI